MAIVFPDSELWLTGALRAALTDVHVGIEVPASRKPREVIVRRDGGPDRFITSTHRFGIRVFADSEKAVSDLADLTSAHVRALAFTGPARAIETTSPFPYDDPSQRPCRYFTAEIAVRGMPLR